MIPDNYDLWEARERKQEKQRSRLPKCDRCREPIQSEHYFDFYGEIYCEECGIKMFRKEVTLDE